MGVWEGSSQGGRLPTGITCALLGKIFEKGVETWKQLKNVYQAKLKTPANNNTL